MELFKHLCDGAKHLWCGLWHGHEYIPVIDATMLRYRVQYRFCARCGRVIDPE